MHLWEPKKYTRQLITWLWGSNDSARGMAGAAFGVVAGLDGVQQTQGLETVDPNLAAGDPLGSTGNCQ